MGKSGTGQLLLFALLFAVIYFLMIRPQRRRLQRQQVLQSSLELGDEIVTFAGFLGIIRRFDGDLVTIELSPGVEARVNRRAITGKVQPAIEQIPPDDANDEAGSGGG